MKEFNISTNVFFGENCLERLDQIQGKRVIIICDAFMVKSGVVDKIKAHLGSCTVSVFDKTVPDPPIEVVSEGIQCLNEVYDLLGLDRTEAGAVVGWILTKNNPDSYVDFGLDNIPEAKLREILSADRNEDIWIRLHFNPDGLIYNMIDKLRA